MRTNWLNQSMQTMRPLRTTLLGLGIGLFVFGSLGISNARPVYADYASIELGFFCYYQSYASGTSYPVDTVYVEGYNQHYNFVEHQFPSFYTYDYPNTWWWMEGRTVYYYAKWSTGLAINGTLKTYYFWDSYAVPYGYSGYLPVWSYKC